ncbi:MAG: ribosome silencing factor [Deltaproteobacteria bacterium]|nr:ribosome silencing factor [Deltaproteobacteria bacterium]
MEIQELAQKAAFFASEKKAKNILILDVAELTSFADYFVICEAQSERQVQAVAQSVISGLKTLDKAPLGIEGLEQGNWVLVDYGDFVVHVFMSDLRHYYNLEGFWHQAKIIPCDF